MEALIVVLVSMCMLLAVVGVLIGFVLAELIGIGATLQKLYELLGGI